MKNYIKYFLVSFFIVVCGAILKIFEVNFASWVIIVGAVLLLTSLFLLLKSLINQRK
jgi:hypothetical protein